jgi:ribosomal protein L37AE/L43A
MGVEKTTVVKYKWTPGQVSFDCLCGIKELILKEAGQTETCRCGRVYRLVHHVELVEQARDPYTCHYCKLKHDKVEAGGLHHCPNNLCSGPGAAYFRSKLKSYVDDTDGSGHTVDSYEWIAMALLDLPEDEVLKLKIIETAKEML